MRTSLGFVWHGCLRPMPDISDPLNGVIGQVSRVCTEPPKPDGDEVTKLHAHFDDMMDGKYHWFPRVPKLDPTYLLDPIEYITNNESWTMGQRLSIVKLFREMGLEELFDPINWRTKFKTDRFYLMKLIAVVS